MQLSVSPSSCLRMLGVGRRLITTCTNVENYRTGTKYKEEKINLDGTVVNFLKTGTGSKTVICLPGAFGTIWTNFKPQIEGLAPELFTLVVWDPPGYGGSRPPSKEFGPRFFYHDAKLASRLMKELGIEKYSVLGWSDGGTTGLVMASEDKRVEKMVVWGAITHVTPTDLIYHKNVTDVRKWPRDLADPLFAAYGHQGLLEMVSRWYGTFAEAVDVRGGDLCTSCLDGILAPTLVIHGRKDPLVPEHHAKFISQRIPNARLYIFEDGNHSVHLRKSGEFNDLVQNFLLSS